MRLVGLCSFYDESPTWLAAHAAACARLVDHMVYVDGAYVLYDREGRSSGVEAHDAIARGCYAAGLDYTLHVAGPWIGNEVEKRAFMFRLAEAITTEEDYYLVVDADTFLTRGDPQLARADLELGEHDAYNVSLVERWDWNTGQDGALIIPQDGEGAPGLSASPLTCVFRAIRGLTVKGAHYLFGYEDPTAKWGFRALWGPSTEYDVAEPGTLQLDFEHWSKFRPADRRNAAQSYYAIRDQHGIEKTTRNFIETADGGIKET